MWIGTEYPEIFNSPLTPGSTLGPLIVIVFLTCIKEGLEDLKRHRSDKKTNNRPQDVLVDGSLENGVRWRDLRVGQLVIVRDRDQIPADLVLIASSSGDAAVAEAVAANARKKTNNKAEMTSSAEVPDVDGGCFIETSNIDGETNLKIREIPQGVQGFLHTKGWANKTGVRTAASTPAASPDVAAATGTATTGAPRRRLSSSFEESKGFRAADRLADLRGTLEFEAPNRSIHTFVGTVRLQHSGGSGITAPLSARNLLLRGASLRNTDWIIGIVVYTGFESKIMKNSRSARTKLSRMETLVNRCIKLILLTQIALATVSMALGLFVNTVLQDVLPWYLFPSGPVNKTAASQAQLDETLLPEGLALWITFFILFNNVVPISLYVTVEMVNFMQAFYIDNDIEMYDPVTDTPALARTSSLNADLGQIEWIFSDKTGTLTCNEMKFRRCAIAGKIYGKASDTGMFRSTKLTALLRNKQSKLEMDFFTALAVCHTVVVERESGAEEDAQEEHEQEHEHEHEQEVKKDATSSSSSSSSSSSNSSIQNDLVYRAESPDEGALVDGAAAMGYTLIDRSGSDVKIRDLTGASLSYRVLAINAFNSTRKRMSMLVKCPRSGKLLLICKGADNVVLERARVGEGESHVMGQQLSAFAGQGLRTLVIAQRVISAEESNRWLARFKHASESVENRKALLAEAAEAIEKDLKILGVTAIEDRLQDGVPDAINDLVRAGIKVWVLTGDKVETAATRTPRPAHLMLSPRRWLRMTRRGRRTPSSGRSSTDC